MLPPLDNTATDRQLLPLPNGGCEPFVKWAGGKRWIAQKIAAMIANHGGRYVEPFLGSGAVFFALAPSAAVLADVNDELVNAFKAVRDLPDTLLDRLSLLTVSRDAFLRVRQHVPADCVSRAARLIYLNRTAYNGLYRVNRKGDFNVPYGCRPGTRLVDTAQIAGCSERLKRATVLCQTFATTLRMARSGDCVFADPPYARSSGAESFVRYHSTVFTWDDQVSLAQQLTRLSREGISVVAFNAFEEDVIRLYPKDSFLAIELPRYTGLSAATAGRGKYVELLLLSHNIFDRCPDSRRIVESLANSSRQG